MTQKPAEVTIARMLRALRRKAGLPPLRVIATQAGTNHTTVGQALSGKRIPRWLLTAAIAEALGGDPADFKPLWVAAQLNEAVPHVPIPTDGQPVERWRVGRNVPIHLYRQLGEESSDDDPPIGTMLTPELAALAVRAVNSLAQR